MSCHLVIPDRFPVSIIPNLFLLDVEFQLLVPAQPAAGGTQGQTENGAQSVKSCSTIVINTKSDRGGQISCEICNSYEIMALTIK